jgi:hypothetical protein
VGILSRSGALGGLASRPNSFVPTEPGNPDFSYAETPGSQLQFPAAAAEKRIHQNQVRSNNILTSARQMGIDVDNDPQYEQIREQARKGWSERALTLGERMLGFIDGPRQMVNLAIQEIAMPGGQNASMWDYMDALWGGIENTEEFKERTGGLDPRSGSLTLELFGWEEEQSLGGKIGRGIADFGLQMVTDPLNYLTFGLSGLGKKVAAETVEQISKKSIDDVLSAVATGTVDDLSSPYLRNLANSLPDLRQRFYGVAEYDEAGNILGYNKNSLADLYEREPSTFEAMQSYMSNVIGKEAPDYETLNKLVGEHIDELALRSQLAEDILKPVLRRDFANIAPGAEELLPMYARGGARVSFNPYTRKGLESGTMIPGSVGLGRRLVGDHVRNILGEMRGRSSMFNKFANNMSSMLDNMDTQRSLLRMASAPEDKGGISGWQWHIAQSSLDRITNRANKEQLKVQLNNLASNLFEQAKVLRDSTGLVDDALDDSKLSASIMRTLMDRLEGAETEFGGVDGILSSFGQHAPTPEATALATKIDEEMTNLANTVRGVTDSYHEVLSRVAPDLVPVLENYVPHLLTQEGRQVIGMLADIGAAVSKRDIARLEANGNPGGLFLAQLIHGVSRGGTAETVMGGRYGGPEGSIGSNTIAALTDEGVMMVQRGELDRIHQHLLEKSLETFDNNLPTGSVSDEFGSHVLPDSSGRLAVSGRQGILPVTKLNELVVPLIKQLAEEKGIKLPNKWDERLFDDNPLEVMTSYIDNLNDSIELWQSMEQLKIAGLAIPKRYVADVNGMVQQIMDNVVRATEDSNMPKPPSKAARNIPDQLFHVSKGGGLRGSKVPDIEGGAHRGRMGPGFYVSNNLEWGEGFRSDPDAISYAVRFTPNRNAKGLDISKNVVWDVPNENYANARLGAFRREPQVLDENAKAGILAAFEELGAEYSITPRDLVDLIDDANLAKSGSWEDFLSNPNASMYEKYQAMWQMAGTRGRGEADNRRFQSIMGKHFDYVKTDELFYGSKADLAQADSSLYEMNWFNPEDLALHDMKEPMIANIAADTALTMSSGAARWLMGFSSDESLKGFLIEADLYTPENQMSQEFFSDVLGNQGPVAPVKSGLTEEALELLDAFPHREDLILPTDVWDAFDNGTIDNEQLAALVRMLNGELGEVKVQIEESWGSDWGAARRLLLEKGFEDVYDNAPGAVGRYLKGYKDWSERLNVVDARDLQVMKKRGLPGDYSSVRKMQQQAMRTSGDLHNELIARHGERPHGFDSFESAVFWRDPEVGKDLKYPRVPTTPDEAIAMTGGFVIPRPEKAGTWSRMSSGAHVLRDADGKAAVYVDLGWDANGRPFAKPHDVQITFGHGSLSELRRMRQEAIDFISSQLDKAPGKGQNFTDDLFDELYKNGNQSRGLTSIIQDVMNQQIMKLPDKVLDGINLGMPAELYRGKIMFDKFAELVNEAINMHGMMMDPQTGQILDIQKNPMARFQAQEGDRFMTLISRAEIMARDLGIPGAEEIFKGVSKHKLGVAAESSFVNPSLFGLGGPAAQEVVFNKDVAQWLSVVANNHASIYTPQGVAALKANANNILRLWRGMATIAKPSFHIRNFIGAAWNNQIVSVRTQDYVKVKNNAIILRNAMKDNLPFDEALDKLAPDARLMFEKAWERDVLAGFVTSEFRKFNDTSKQTRLAWLKAWDVDNFALTKGGSLFMESIEDFMRMSAFARFFDPADPDSSADLAAAIVRAVHFDYADLTPIESRIKAWVPFFVWSRRNIPLQLSVYAENPKIINRYNHMMTAIEDQFESETQDDLPHGDYFGAYAAGTSYYVNSGTPFWARVIIDPDLPVADIARLPGLSPPQIAEFAMNMMGPHIGSVQDMLSQRDFEDVNAPAPFNQVAKGLSYLGFFDRTTDGDVRIPYWMRTLMETAVPYNREVIEPLFGGPTDPDRQQRLGIGQDDGYLESVIKSLGNSMARGVGIKMTTPGDARSVAGRSDAELDQIIQGMRFGGELPPSEG